MTSTTEEVHKIEGSVDAMWPDSTQTVSYVGSACVVQGAADFDVVDLNVVRRQFPGRRVTLDGDVITVWPTGAATADRPRPASPDHGTDGVDDRDVTRADTTRSAPSRSYHLPADRLNAHSNKSTSGYESELIRPELYE